MRRLMSDMLNEKLNRLLSTWLRQSDTYSSRSGSLVASDDRKGRHKFLFYFWQQILSWDVAARPSRAPTQPGFLTYRVVNPSAWPHTGLGESCFLPGRTENLAGLQPWRPGLLCKLGLRRSSFWPPCFKPAPNRRKAWSGNLYGLFSI